MSVNRTENISPSEESDDSGILVKETELMCPICKDLYVYPRNYDCGHTLCELCMLEMDKIDEGCCLKQIIFFFVIIVK